SHLALYRRSTGFPKLGCDEVATDRYCAVGPRFVTAGRHGYRHGAHQRRGGRSSRVAGRMSWSRSTVTHSRALTLLPVPSLTVPQTTRRSRPFCAMKALSSSTGQTYSRGKAPTW